MISQVECNSLLGQVQVFVREIVDDEIQLEVSAFSIVLDGFGLSASGKKVTGLIYIQQQSEKSPMIVFTDANKGNIIVGSSKTSNYYRFDNRGASVVLDFFNPDVGVNSVSFRLYQYSTMSKDYYTFTPPLTANLIEF